MEACLPIGLERAEGCPVFRAFGDSLEEGRMFQCTAENRNMCLASAVRQNIEWRKLTLSDQMLRVLLRRLAGCANHAALQHDQPHM